HSHRRGGRDGLVTVAPVSGHLPAPPTLSVLHPPLRGGRGTAGQSPARAARASSRHSAKVWRDRASRTAGTQTGAIDRLVTPRPARTGASPGSPAASPQTPTG